MARLLKEVLYDLRFIQSHTLQPKWWKVLKVFVLVGFLAGYYGLFGLAKTLVFLALFMLLNLALHMLYRAKTKRFTESWLDFAIAQEGEERNPKRIGPHYYVAIVVNTIFSAIASQSLA